MGTARAPVAGSGDCPAWTAKVSECGVFGPEWAIKINYLECNVKILSRLGVVCYGVACPSITHAPLTRFLAALLMAALPLGVYASAGKHATPRAARVAAAEFTKDGEP